MAMLGSWLVGLCGNEKLVGCQYESFLFIRSIHLVIDILYRTGLLYMCVCVRACV